MILSGPYAALAQTPLPSLWCIPASRMRLCSGGGIMRAK
uniref:Uncharacterized protein n=1 Tax=Anguilla anguilla TaxID=7936 RepID=A0A0E9SVG8_ANGAN